MANQQLIDYIKESLKSGTPKEAIKKNLVTVGWAERDVDDAFAATMPQSAAPAAAPAAAAPAKPVASAPATRPAAGAAASPLARDIVIGGSGSVFRERDTLASSAGSAAKPAPVTVQQPKQAPAEMKKNPMASLSPKSPTLATSPTSALPATSGIRKYLLPGIGGIVAIGLIAFLVVLAMDNADLEAKAEKATADQASAKLDLETLTKEKADLKKQLDDLRNGTTNVLGELTLFLKPAAGDGGVFVHGTIGGGEGKPFTITTQSGIKIVIANSSDAGTIALLTPLIGSSAQVAITPGGTISASFIGGATLVEVNGTAVSSARAKATAPGAPSPPAAAPASSSSSTPPNASTTKP